MKHMVTTALLAASALTCAPAQAADVAKPAKATVPVPAANPAPDIAAKPKALPKLTLDINGISPGSPIPTHFAYCRPDGRGQTRDADNISPEISWRDVPENTRSFAVIVVDKDVPADFGPANQQGQEIEAKAKRRDFYHWVAVDLPGTLRKIPEGKASTGVVKDGKPVGRVDYGLTGSNDFGQRSGGYDGPCPPWNDKRLHHYYFRVYALDVPTLNAPTVGLTGKMAEKLIKDHVLAQGEVVGTYSNNPEVLSTLK